MRFNPAERPSFIELSQMDFIAYSPKVITEEIRQEIS